MENGRCAPNKISQTQHVNVLPSTKPKLVRQNTVRPWLTDRTSKRQSKQIRTHKKVSEHSNSLQLNHIYDTNGQTWGGIINEDSKEFAGLTAAWLELIFGIKAELLNNVFLGLNVQIKARLAEKSPSNFENLYIPGFGRTYDSSKIGTGFSYTITYLLPIYKKTRIQKLSEEDNEKTAVE